MARALGFRVVVEGVETASIYRTVRDMGCDEIQGYFIARPMPSGEFTSWLTRFEVNGIPDDESP